MTWALAIVGIIIVAVIGMFADDYFDKKNRELISDPLYRPTEERDE